VSSAGPRDSAHCEQNLALEGFSYAHLGHCRLRGIAH
jgi:hypothetical protein